MEKRFIVTGVLISGPGWNREPIVSEVSGPSAEWAISVVDCRALEEGKLFLSAEAHEVTPEPTEQDYAHFAPEAF